MNGVESVRGGVSGNAAGTPDAGNKGNFMGRAADGRKRAVNGGHHPKIAAARTPDGLQVALVVFGYVLLDRLAGHGAHFMNPFRLRDGAKPRQIFILSPHPHG